MTSSIIYPDLNPCGGGERLTIATMKAMAEIGMEFDLITFKQPDISRIENAYGKNFSSVIHKIKKIRILSPDVNIVESESDFVEIDGNHDLTVNTHGDTLPYYRPSFSKKNAITYCHFPCSKYDRVNDILGYRIREKLMKNSIVLTNSMFSSRALYDTFGIKESIILSPPVDTDFFRHALAPNGRSSDNYVLVISRITAYKKIEKAIKLAKILKDNNIGKGMIITGNLNYTKNNCNYYSFLKEMILKFNLNDFVELELNVSINKLRTLMTKSKVYFHPMLGEHFGISIVEAMSAGLIPVVPHIGGQTEFVPLKYHYHNLEEAAQIISSAFSLPYSEKILMSNIAKRFSTASYVKKVQRLITINASS